MRRPHGSVVGPPNSSWLNQLPSRPIACATSRPGRERVGERREPDALAAAADPGTDRAERDGTPDAEAALPDEQRPDGVAARAEVRLRAR